MKIFLAIAFYLVLIILVSFWKKSIEKRINHRIEDRISRLAIKIDSLKLKDKITIDKKGCIKR